jgi:hypothetical protein
MKIHPLFVHFPIALFFIYAVIEIFGLDHKYTELKWAKRVLGILSPIFAYLSILTGGLLEDMFRNDANLQQIIRVHENMATFFMWTASLLALGIIAEIIREKIFLALREEVPYTTHVEVESIEEKEDIFVIKAIVYTYDKRYKGMIVGVGGRAIKEIGIAARKELEAALNKKVFLELEVETDKHWMERM